MLASERKKAIAKAKAIAAQLDKLFAKARNPAASERTANARHFYRGIEELAKMVGHLVGVYIQPTDKNFSFWRETLMERLAGLAPEIQTWDLFLGMADIASMDRPVRPTAIHDEVWPGIEAEAEKQAGMRLWNELGINKGGSSYLDTARLVIAGKVDREGNKLR